MICKKCLRQYNRSDTFNAFNYLPTKTDSLVYHGFDICSDLVSLGPELHSGLNLAAVALLYDSVGLVYSCECLVKATSVAQLLTLIEHALDLFCPLSTLLLIISCRYLYYSLPPQEV